MSDGASSPDIRGGYLLVCVGSTAVGGGEGGGTGLPVPGGATLLASRAKQFNRGIFSLLRPEKIEM